MISEIIGKLHPLVVHLPIGFITLTLILVILSRRKPELKIDHLLPYLLRLCFLSSVVATFTGYIMPKGSDYSEALLSKHFWSAVSLTVLCGLMIIPYFKKYHTIGYWLIVISMVLSGHFGGSLTHGENYFSISKSSLNDEILTQKDGTVYQDLILPILTKKCMVCHNDAKSKGGLKMHDFPNLMKGGKSGPIIVSGNPDNSEMVKRLLLPHSDEHHMPPKGKTPLTESEIALIQFWIKNGASKSYLIANIPKDDPINSFMPTLLSNPTSKLPEIKSQKPLSPSLLQSLSDQGVNMIPLDAKKNLYKANLSEANEKSLRDLNKVIPNVIIISIQDKKIQKEWATFLANCTHLHSLNFKNCTFTKGTDLNFSQLTNLHTINFTGSNTESPDQTKVQLSPSVRKIHLYNSNLKSYFLKESKFDNSITIDTGGYVVPTLVTDTTRL